MNSPSHVEWHPGDMRHAGVPERYRTFRPPEGEWGDAAHTLWTKVGQKCMVGLLGKRGTGKTAMACAMIGETLRLRERASIFDQNAAQICRYTTAMEIFLRVRSTYQDEAAEKESDVLKAYRTPHLLVIDEIQERGDTAFEDRVLGHILDGRYSSMKPTILVGNLEPKELARSLGPSIADRLRESGAVIECNWGSFRRPSLAS